MKMKKALMTFMFIFIFIIEHLSISADASDLPGSGFYATPEEQERFWNSMKRHELNEEDGLSIRGIKESITPLYTIDWEDVAKTGMIKIRPSARTAVRAMVKAFSTSASSPRQTVYAK